MIKYLLIIVFTTNLVSGLDSIKFYDLNQEGFISIQLEKYLDKDNIDILQDEVASNMTWRGILLFDLIYDYTDSDYDAITLVSEDNYLVALNREEISEYKPLLALILEDEILKPGDRRLIVPEMGRMYWITNIKEIRLQKDSPLITPRIIYQINPLLKRFPLIEIDDIPGMVSGYQLDELLRSIFRITDGEYFFLSLDGLSHKLSWDPYLKGSLLAMGSEGFSFVNPLIPRGMQVKNLLYMQYEDTGIMFYDEDDIFERFLHLADTIGFDIHDFKFFDEKNAFLGDDFEMMRQNINEIYYFKK